MSGFSGVVWAQGSGPYRVNAVAAKLCKEQQISFSNNVKYSNFIDGKYFCEIRALKDLTVQRKSHLVKHCASIFD